MEHEHLTNSQSPFNSRIDMKFDEYLPSGFRKKLFNDIKILYKYTVQEQGYMTFEE